MDLIQGLHAECNTACAGVFKSSYEEPGAIPGVSSFNPDHIYRVRSDLIRLQGIAYLTSGKGFGHLEALGLETCRIGPGQRILIDGPEELALFVPTSHCLLRCGTEGVEITFGGSRSISTVRLYKKSGRIAYTSPEIPCIFDCLSSICTDHAISSPHKSNPLFRGVPPSIRVMKGYENIKHSRHEFSLHLPPDLRYLYSAAPLAYYLGASIELSDAPHITFDSHEPMELPEPGGFEAYAGEALRRTFYMDCAVRYEASSGESLHGIDINDLFGYRAGEIFDMSMEERFLLYSTAKQRVPCPPWHMASYLDPVPKSVEALPFLLRSLSSIHAPVCRPVTEREVIASSVKTFLGKAPSVIDSSEVGQDRKIIVPSLCEASTHYWFSSGYPVDAVKAIAEAFENRHCYDIAKGRRASVEIVCNEEGMKGEVHDIANELARSRCDVDVLWNASAREFIDVFAEGHNVVQFIGHCSADGFQCSDGFARASDVVEDHTPMFFFNSCSSHSEAMRLIEKGSVCGIATLFRVLEEAAMDVCKSFYRMFGAGYSALVSLEAAKACSVLGREYLLLGDGSYSCFDASEARPFFEVLRRECGYSLRCRMDSVDKGSIVTSWQRSNKKPVTDMGFETQALSLEHLMQVSHEFKGYCLYGRQIYRSVNDAVKQLKKDETPIECRGKRSRFPGSRL